MIAAGPEASSHYYAAWSRDGKRIALSDVNHAPGPIQILDVASGKSQELADLKGLIFYKTVWMADGSGLYVQYQDVSAGLQHNQIGVVSYPGGQFRAITKDTNNYVSMTLSSDGKTLATIQSKHLFTLYVIPAAGTGPNTPNPAIPQQQKGLLTFAWAGNDGFYLAGDAQLVRVSSDGNNMASVLSNASIPYVSACPDGRTLLLSLVGQNGGTDTNIWRINTDGSVLKQLSNGHFDSNPECSTDSKWVYFEQRSESRIQRVPIDGGAAETVPGTPFPHAFLSGRNFDLSSDGKFIAGFLEIGEANQVHKILLIPLDAGPRPQVSLLDPNPAISSHGPRFTPDMKAVVYPIIQNGVDNLWLQPINGSAGHQITNFKSEGISAFRWSPDGKSMGVLSVRTDADVVLLRDTGASGR